MSRRRKPAVKSLDAATEAVVWRARMLCEILDGREGDNPMIAAIRNMEHALEDYEASRTPAGAQGTLAL